MKSTDTRELLLQATLKLISEKGYLGATTREIACEAGVTELTLFRRFGSKERLFEELLKSYTFLPRLRELLPELEGLDVEKAFETIAMSFIMTLRERKAMIKILFSEITTYPEKVGVVYNKFLGEMRSALAAYIEKLQGQGVLRRDLSSETAARVFLWMMFSYFRSEEILRTDGVIKKSMHEKKIREMVDLFIHGSLNGKQRSGGRGKRYADK
jgi:AcrR family transcriptional regulator